MPSPQLCPGQPHPSHPSRRLSLPRIAPALFIMLPGAAVPVTSCRSPFPGLRCVADSLIALLAPGGGRTRFNINLLCKNTPFSQVEVSVKYLLDSTEFLSSLCLLSSLFLFPLFSDFLSILFRVCPRPARALVRFFPLLFSLHGALQG